MLIYLNTLPPGVGGETRFPRLETAFRPEQGTALVFFPCTLDAQLDPQALHAAEPITAAAETKYVAQIWIRQGVFCAPPAPPAAPAPMAGDDF